MQEIREGRIRGPFRRGAWGEARQRKSRQAAWSARSAARGALRCNHTAQGLCSSWRRMTTRTSGKCTAASHSGFCNPWPQAAGPTPWSRELPGSNTALPALFKLTFKLRSRRLRGQFSGRFKAGALKARLPATIQLRIEWSPCIARMRQALTVHPTLNFRAQTFIASNVFRRHRSS